MERVKRWLGIGTPGGLDDILIRGIKAGIIAFCATPFGLALFRCADDVASTNCGNINLNLALSAAMAFAGGIVSVLLNTVLYWATGGSGQKTGSETEVDRDAETGEVDVVTAVLVAVVTAIVVVLLVIRF